MIIKSKKKDLICRDPLSMVENYDNAVADSEPWQLHHRLELTLDGEFAHSRADLIRLGMYWHRPYFELIFLPRSEHRRIHATKISEFTREKHSIKLSDDTKKKMSESRKGKAFSSEHKENLARTVRDRNAKYKYSWRIGPDGKRQVSKELR